MEHHMVMSTNEVGTRYPGQAERVMTADHLSHTARFESAGGRVGAGKTRVLKNKVITRV